MTWRPRALTTLPSTKPDDRGWEVILVWQIFFRGLGITETRVAHTAKNDVHRVYTISGLTEKVKMQTEWNPIVVECTV